MVLRLRVTLAQFRPKFFIPRWTTHLCILYQVCDARVAEVLYYVTKFIVSMMPIISFTLAHVSTWANIFNSLVIRGQR